MTLPKDFKQEEEGQTMNYWKEFLGSLDSCYFPTANDAASLPKERHSTGIVIDDIPQLQHMSEQLNLNPTDVLQTMWALLLHYYLRQNMVCFGCLDSTPEHEKLSPDSRDVLNMHLRRLEILEADRVMDIFDRLQKEQIESSVHKFCVPSKICSEIRLAESRINTAVALNCTKPKSLAVEDKPCGYLKSLEDLEVCSQPRFHWFLQI
jgi:hypothetical protein